MGNFEPITIHETTSAFRLSGSNWEYAVSRVSGLLERAVVRGDSWLAGSVPDLWASGAIDPRSEAYHAGYTPSASVRLVSAGPEQAVLESEGAFARIDGETIPLRWQLRYAFDADGTVQVDVTVRAQGKLVIRWLSLGQGQVDQASCRFVVHEADVGAGAHSCRPVCHALEDGPFAAGGRFIPWLHFGNDRSGLDLVFPHSAGAAWGWTDTSPYPTGDPLGRAGDRMLLRAGKGRPSWETFIFRNLYEPVDEGWSISDTFYLSAVPGKEPRPEANDLRVWWPGPHQYRSGWRAPDEAAIARWAAAGANLVIGGANWRSGDYSHPEPPEDTERFVATCHRYGLRVLPYITFTDLEFGAPAFAAHGRDWRIDPVSEFNYRSHLMCYGAEGWQEHWEREVLAAWERFSFDGLYIDFWAGRMVCRNHRHGCTGPHGRFTAAGLRRMARFAHSLVQQRDGMIVANSNIMPLAMLNNWFDVRLLGEWDNPEEVDPLPTRVFHNAHRFGTTNLLLVGKVPVITEKTVALAEAFQGPPVLSAGRTPAERELLSVRARLLASFGTDRAIARNTFEAPAASGLEGIRTSFYRRDDNGEFLLTLSRLESEPAIASFSSIEDVCGPLQGRWLAFCVETDELLGGRMLPVEELRRLSLEVPGASLRTLWLLPDPGAPVLLYALSGRPRPAAEWNPDERCLSFTVEHPSLAEAGALLVGPVPEAITAGEAAVAFRAGAGCVRASVPCNTPVSARYPAPGLSQLRMRFTQFNSLPAVEPPKGYEIRRYRPGDEAAWAEILNSVHDLGHWDVPRVIRLLQAETHAAPEGAFFATWQGLPVATACTIVRPGRERPELGWVAVMPEHQGHSLGCQVCLAVLHFMRAQGAAEASLLTDDFRIPAIKTYLRLGFEPEVSDPSHPERWQRILTELGSV